MDNLRTGSLENVAHLEDEAHFEYIDHDVTSHITVAGELDEVYHFALLRAPTTLSASRSSRWAPWSPTTL
jgi:dTDP-glucose 4,6-dehydratase